VPKEGMIAHCNLPERKVSAAQKPKWSEREILVLLSGPASEELYSGAINRRGAAGDFNGAIELTNDHEYKEEYIDEIYDKAKTFIKNHWEQVKLLANALLEHKHLSDAKMRKQLRVARLRRNRPPGPDEASMVVKMTGCGTINP
jgi:preprotein translocase subunit Sss1